MRIPSEVSEDQRCSEIRCTEGNDFSALEPLQYWIDIIVSGIRPSQVKILGINGGIVSAAEYRIASKQYRMVSPLFLFQEP